MWEKLKAGTVGGGSVSICYCAIGRLKRYCGKCQPRPPLCQVAASHRCWRRLERMISARRHEIGHTAMIQMLSKLHIPMAPCRDMEVALHFVPLNTSENSTRIARSPPQLRRLRKQPPLPPRSSPHLPQDMSHMRVLLPLTLHGSTIQRMHSLSILPVNPLAPIRRLPLQ